MTSLIALRSQGTGTSSSWRGKAVYLRSRAAPARSSLTKHHQHNSILNREHRPLTAPARRLATLSCIPYEAPFISSLDALIPYSDDDSSPTILACSSIVALHPDDETLLARLLQWLKSALQKCREALLITIRGSEVILRLCPLLLLTPASVFADSFLKHNVISDATWWYVTRSMQSLGPAFVKLCQWIATRRDIFPPHVCDRLSELHDKGIVHSWAHTRAVLTEAFGPYESKGLRVDHDKVIGCGSAAQVYEGSVTTRDENGKEHSLPVAVKVLHPRFEELVERDLLFMQSVANLLDSLPSQQIKMLSLPRATSNFGSVLRRQADLRVEGENLKRFRANFYRDNDQDEADSAIFFPRPVDGWISAEILVEDLVTDAKPIADFIRDDSVEGNRVRKELAGPLLRAFLKMIFLDNYMHGDLHPGNVLVKTSMAPVKPSNSWWGTTETEGVRQEKKRTIVFLDAGIATSLSADDHRNLRDLFRAVILNNGENAGRLMVDRAKYERCSQVEGGVDAFAKGIDELVSEFHDRRKDGLTLGAVRIGSLLSRVLDLCRVHGVEIDPAMATVVISTLVLEGLGRSLEPSLNLMDFAIPFVLGRGRV